MNISQAVICRIEELSRKRNLSINAPSNLSGVTQSTVNDIISGKTYNAGIGTIKKLCDGLGVSIQYFFDSDLFSSLEQEIK